MSSTPGAPQRRAPLPTLTEDDIREQGERATLPPPVPIGELVGKMMGDLDGEPAAAPRAAPRPPALSSARARAPQTPGVPDVGFELDELPASAEADILAEIGDAYLARLGRRSDVPFTLMSADAALRAPLDHWAGFVLSLVDGAASVDDILDASSLPEVEALRLLCELRERGLIDLRPRR